VAAGANGDADAIGGGVQDRLFDVGVGVGVLRADDGRGGHVRRGVRRRGVLVDKLPVVRVAYLMDRAGKSRERHDEHPLRLLFAGNGRTSNGRSTAALMAASRRGFLKS